MGDIADWHEQELFFGGEDGYEPDPEEESPFTAASIECPYCGDCPVLQDGSQVYPGRPDLQHRLFWVCWPCDARVGCHAHGTRPMGTLANVELRRERMIAHGIFDRLWKQSRTTRSEAYTWLAEQLGIPGEECHIGLFDLHRCRRAIAIAAFAGNID